MRKIWKFELDPKEEVHRIELPLGSTVLTVQRQRDKIALWVSFTEESEEQRAERAAPDWPKIKNRIVRHFRVALTGQPFADDDLRTYIGTVQFETKTLHAAPRRADGRPTLGDLIGGEYITIDYFVCHVFEETP